MSRIHTFKPALSEKILLRYNFFELYPFDGGGSFINRAMLDFEEDDRNAYAILNGGALNDFGGWENLDFFRFERWSSIEKSCWLNRMYFLVPMARTFKLNGDEKLAIAIKKILFRFMKCCPGPESQEETLSLEKEILYARDHGYNASGNDFDGPVSYQWFDFQPASRFINIIHSLFFVRESSIFCETELQKLDKMLFQHAQVIYWKENDLTNLHPDNHQAIRALALLIASVYFQDHPMSEKWRKTAETLCNYHMLNDFLPDGILIDLSPSYHFFETWIVRDMMLLMKREHFHISDDALNRLKLAFAACNVFRQPDGYSTVISDGYPLQMDGFLSSLSMETPSSAEVVFSTAKFAIKKQKNDFLFFDCSPLLETLAHYHGGKQAVTLFFDGKPFLVDSGCCNYDDTMFSEYYKQCHAHSTLLINGQGDSLLKGRYTWLKAPQCTISNWNNNEISSIMTSDAPEWDGITWSRRIICSPNDVQIIDDVTSPREVEMSFIFNLHPNVQVKNNDKTVILTHGSICCQAKFQYSVQIHDSVGYLNFQQVPSQQLVIHRRGKGGCFHTVFQKLSRDHNVVSM